MTGQITGKQLDESPGVEDWQGIIDGLTGSTSRRWEGRRK